MDAETIAALIASGEGACTEFQERWLSQHFQVTLTSRHVKLRQSIAT
jgi:hypothetical protein